MITDVFNSVFDLLLWVFDLQATIWVYCGGVFALFIAVFTMYSVWRLIFSRASGGFGSASDGIRRYKKGE